MQQVGIVVNRRLYVNRLAQSQLTLPILTFLYHISKLFSSYLLDHVEFALVILFVLILVSDFLVELGQLVFSHVLNEVSICDVGFGVMNELLPHNEPKLNRLSAAGNHEEDKEALPVAVCSFNFGIGRNESLV